jgi:hypothetical protein
MIARPVWTMKLLVLLCSVLLLAPSLPAQQNGIAQDSELITLPAGDKFLRQYGYDGRSDFLQVSDANDPLGKWNWAPIIESGNDEDISYEVDGTAPKSFFRLKYTDQVPGPNETLESADFDQDSISNIDEINPPLPLLASDATDPLDSDTDHDGMNDVWERAHGLDPNDDGSINPGNGPAGYPDGDGLTNAQEQALGSNPKSSDTDLDGATDSEEAASGHDLTSNQSHPPIWIRTQRRSFHGLPYIQSSMDWNPAGTVTHDGFPTDSAPGICAAFLAADCPFPTQTLAPVYSRRFQIVSE